MTDRAARPKRGDQLCLDHTLLAPGDVILHMGTGALSRTIALATKSRFSHARLSLGGLVAYEALKDGIFPTTFTFEPVLHKGSRRMAVPLSGIQGAAVFRHRSLAQRVQTQRYDVQDELLDITGKFLGRPYSELIRLLAAAPQPVFGALSRWLQIRLRRGSLGERDRGVFCSELVSRVMDAMGLQLFSPPKNSGEVSPGDLARSRYLQEVPGAVFTATPIPPTKEEEKEKVIWDKYRISREVLVQADRSRSRLKDNLDALHKRVRRHK